MQVGELEKSAIVYGNRPYKKGIGGVRIGPAENFVSMPLDLNIHSVV